MASTGLTKAQIIQAAYENVGRGVELATIGDRILNTILNLLYEAYGWKCLEQLANIAITGGSQTFTLPSDYLRWQTFVLIRSDLNPTDPPNFALQFMEMENYQLLRNPLTTSLAPTHFSLLRKFNNYGNPGVVGYVWPIPTASYTARMLYYYKPAFDTGDNTVPELSDQYTLIDLVTNEFLGLGYTHNVQTKTYHPDLLEKTIARYKKAENDSGIYSHQAQLDKRIFRPHRMGSRRGSWIDVNR